MKLDELETAIVKLPQSDFDHFTHWFQQLLSQKTHSDSLDALLERVTDENLHVEIKTDLEQGREKIVW